MAPVTRLRWVRQRATRTQEEGWVQEPCEEEDDGKGEAPAKPKPPSAEETPSAEEIQIDLEEWLNANS
jgi:hypothetical protein